MKLSQKEEERLDAIAIGASKATYWIVIATCLAFPIIFLLMFFGEYAGVVYKDHDIVDWCEQYHPTWTYEQCESMVGR
jgi:hypothetical protein